MADVLIFDDDPALGDWAGEVLRGLGLSVEHYLSAAGAAQIVREARPRAAMQFQKFLFFRPFGPIQLGLILLNPWDLGSLAA
jgi:CheY-like chemotaxis protein